MAGAPHNEIHRRKHKGVSYSIRAVLFCVCASFCLQGPKYRRSSRAYFCPAFCIQYLSLCAFASYVPIYALALQHFVSEHKGRCLHHSPSIDMHHLISVSSHRSAFSFSRGRMTVVILLQIVFHSSVHFGRLCQPLPSSLPAHSIFPRPLPFHSPLPLPSRKRVIQATSRSGVDSEGGLRVAVRGARGRMAANPEVESWPAEKREEAGWLVFSRSASATCSITCVCGSVRGKGLVSPLE